MLLRFATAQETSWTTQYRIFSFTSDMFASMRTIKFQDLITYEKCAFWYGWCDKLPPLDLRRPPNKELPTR